MTSIEASTDAGTDPVGAPTPHPFARVSRFVSSPWRLAAVTVVAVLAIDAGGTDEGSGVCLFRRCTGGYCPGCGLTRSARHLTRGQFAAAWADHPMMVLVAIQAVFATVLAVAVPRLRERLSSPRVIAGAAILDGVALLAIWVVRLADGSIPRFY